MKITNQLLKQIIKEELKTILSENVPQEAKEKLFNRMKKNNQVPDDGDINDAEFWEVKKGDYGYKDAVIVNGKRYYGEI